MFDELEELANDDLKYKPSSMPKMDRAKSAYAGPARKKVDDFDWDPPVKSQNTLGGSYAL